MALSSTWEGISATQEQATFVNGSVNFLIIRTTIGPCPAWWFSLQTLHAFRVQCAHDAVS